MSRATAGTSSLAVTSPEPSSVVSVQLDAVTEVDNNYCGDAHHKNDKNNNRDSAHFYELPGARSPNRKAAVVADPPSSPHPDVCTDWGAGALLAGPATVRLTQEP